MEIDESKFGRRKCNRGRRVHGHWVFGGLERITCFLVEVEKRDAATLSCSMSDLEVLYIVTCGLLTTNLLLLQDAPTRQ